LPLVAIGGLRVEHAAEMIAAGADGIALISDLRDSPHPSARATEWLRAWPHRNKLISKEARATIA